VSVHPPTQQESNHGATKSVYGADPDGNEFEIMWMLQRREWGLYDNTAPTDHLDLTAEVQRRSGVRTAGRMTPTLRTPRSRGAHPARRDRPGCYGTRVDGFGPG
jgi:hypothetical protein